MGFGQRLGALMERDGYTMITLAEKLDTTSASLCRWKRGTNNPPPEIIERLCNIFDVTADYLIMGK